MYRPKTLSVSAALIAALGLAALLVLSIDRADSASGEDPSAPTGQAASSPVAESLPCTGPSEAVNFTVFSLGPEPAGLPLTATIRRCDSHDTAVSVSANYVSYIYGDCAYRDPEAGEGGCRPPLEVQSWPACQRSLADYSLEGGEYPHRELSSEGGADVLEFEEGGRIEVYTGTATVVIFANQPALARKAVALLRAQQAGAPPARNAAALDAPVPYELVAPSQGATKGELECAA